MDHLQLPRAPKHPSITIPYLETQIYDRGKFETYHDRHRWTDADISGSETCSKSLDERAAFVQSWLFFGLLASLFGGVYYDSDWIQLQDSGQSTVTLSKLQDRLDQYYPRDQTTGAQISNGQQHTATNSNPQPEQLSLTLELKVEELIKDFCPTDSQDDEIRDLLNSAHELNLHVFYRGPYNHNLDLICLSVAALGERISAHFGILDDNLWLRSTLNNLLYQRMLTDGWCPIEIIKAGKSHSLGEIYYLSNLERPGPTRRHNNCQERIKLEDVEGQGLFCRSSEDLLRCTAYDLDWRTYKTEHVPGCACDELFAEQSELEMILERGFFPVVLPTSISESHSQATALADSDNKKALGENLLYLPLASTEKYQKYVCISHVWSDGLGNPHANALPRCQYLRLCTMVSELYPSEVVPFWIDTICVPREPRALRRRAVMLMRKTYWDADVVLVLDKYLLDFEQQNHPKVELWLRLLNCGWIRRLWTLQESALAKRVLLQLKGAVVDLDEAVKINKLNNPESDALTLEWSRLRISWDRWTSDISNQPHRLLGTVSDALAWRSTSIAEDEAVCLAAITNLSPDQVEQILLRTSHEDRMIHFWSMQTKLSTNILFWGGPRIQKSPFKWAPLSFLNQGPAPFLDFQDRTQFRPGKLCELGLQFSLPGMILGRWTRKFRPRIFLFTSQSVPADDSSILGSSTCYALASDLDRISVPQDERDNVILALILQNPISFVDQLSPGGAMAALVVSIQQQDAQMQRQRGSRSPDGSDAPLVTATPISLATIERVDRLDGWVRPLAQLRSKTLEKFSGDIDVNPTRQSVVYSGTEVGHRNSDSDSQSDITVICENGRVMMFLKDLHVMYDVVLTDEQQEWCIG